MKNCYKAFVKTKTTNIVILPKYLIRIYYLSVINYKTNLKKNKKCYILYN